MEKLNYNYDFLTGLHEEISIDDETGKMQIKRWGDVEPIIDKNKALQSNEEYKHHGIKKGMQHVAHIPDAVILKWRTEGIDIFNKDHWQKIKEKLRDPDWKYLRTTLGKI